MNAMFFVFAAMLIMAPPQAQDPARLIEMARSGRAADAWKIWRTQTASVEHTRTGVLIAAAAQEIGTGITLYTDLVARSRKDDPDALRTLAVAAAAGLIAAPADDVGLGACAIVLDAGTVNEPCKKSVEAIRSAADRDAQGVAVYRLANAGYRPWPELIDAARRNLSPATRLTVARTFTRLPLAERVDVLAPLFDGNADPASLSGAARLLGDLPGPESLTLLMRLVDQPQLDMSVRLSVRLALARHGDAASLQYVQENRSTFIGPRLIDMGIALALARSPYGPDPKRLIETTPGAERARVAAGLMAREPTGAIAALRAMMGHADPTLRAAALSASGPLKLGFDRAVYARLTDTESAARLAAIEAVLQTVGG